MCLPPGVPLVSTANLTSLTVAKQHRHIEISKYPGICSGCFGKDPTLVAVIMQVRAMLFGIPAPVCVGGARFREVLIQYALQEIIRSG